MQNTLIDAGPLIALFNKNDKYHIPMLDFLKSYQGTLITTWPVISEVAHMLDFHVQVQADFLQWVQKGAVSIYPIQQDSLERIIEMILKYSDLPMDLADATLLVVSEDTGIRDIISADSDFHVYRTIRKETFNNIFLT